MRLKEFISKMYHNNDGTRSLFESIAIPEVSKALKDWVKEVNHGVIIGGAAIGYHGKPRMTFDIDVLFHPDEIPLYVEGFKRIRPGAFQHNETHVEIEVITAKMINIDQRLVDEVISSSTESDSVRIASPSGIVALKLGRLKNNDIGDIVQMINTGKVDLSSFTLSDKNLEDFEEIKRKYV